jgi:hypothetical protein
LAALVFESRFYSRSLKKRPVRRPATAVPMGTFEAHDAHEGLIVSKCVWRLVKRKGLAIARLSIPVIVRRRL